MKKTETRGEKQDKMEPPEEEIKQNRQAVEKKHVTLTDHSEKKTKQNSGRPLEKKQEEKQDGLRLTARKNRILAGKDPC